MKSVDVPSRTFGVIWWVPTAAQVKVNLMQIGLNVAGMAQQGLQPCLFGSALLEMTVYSRNTNTAELQWKLKTIPQEIDITCNIL